MTWSLRGMYGLLTLALEFAVDEAFVLLALVAAGALGTAYSDIRRPRR